MATQGEYITNRLLPDFIEQACSQHGIDFQAFSDQWVLRLEKDSQRRWVIGYSFDINSTASSALARDKVASYLALNADDIPAVEHFLARSRATTEVLTDNFSMLPSNAPVVIKPLEGASGHGVHYFPSWQTAAEYMSTQLHTDWALSPWNDIRNEYRLIMVDGKVLCAYQKTQPKIEGDLRLYNLGKGARAVNVEADSEMTSLAQKSCRCLGLRLAAVDIAELDNGERIIMEVNEGIMMEHYARQSTEYREITEEVYAAIIKKMFE